MAEELPPIYLQFKGDISGIQQSLKAIEDGLANFQTTTQTAGTAAQELGAKTVAAGVMMANIFSNLWNKVSSFGKETISAFETVSGEVGKMRKVLGGSAEDMSQLRFAAEETGLASGKLIIAIRSLSGHLTKNDDVIKQMQITYRDANGELLPTKEILANLADRFAAMPNGIEKTRLATQLFGRSGIDLISTLNLGSKGLKEMYKEADKLGLQLSGEDLASAKAYTMAKREMSAAIEGVQVSIGKKLIPYLTLATNYINSAVLPWVKALIDGLVGNKSVKAGLDAAGQGAFNLGNKIRGIMGFIIAFRGQLVLTAAVLATMWLTTKMIAGITAFLEALTVIRKAMLAVRTSALAAWVAEMFMLNPIAGIAALTLGIAAISLAVDKVTESLDKYSLKIPELNLGKGTDLGDWKPDSLADQQQKQSKRHVVTLFETLEQERQKYAARVKLKKLGASSGLIDAVLGSEHWQHEVAKLVKGGESAVKQTMALYRQGAGGQKEYWEAKKAAAEAAYQKELRKLDGIGQKLESLDARFGLSSERLSNSTYQVQIANVRSYIHAVNEQVRAAQIEERKTRGTNAHAAAVNTLNSGLREQTKLQNVLNNLMVDAAKAAEEQNRQQAMLNSTMSASNSWLAAQVKTSGAQVENASSFVNVPVIIDGQTIFRVTQKVTLENNRRNVSNGLSLSGNLI